ncbi:MAG TPA: hypothetical protein VFE47_28910 [Tepidisphaeraceae bacterium]|jgi:DUF971 family protein|nr:hypothetical protein [Tepidisphaeraceae bacterium]
MSHRAKWDGILLASLIAATLLLAPTAKVHGDDKSNRADAQQRAREHWENVVAWFGDEETGEWTLRIRDSDVHERGWFEFLELWQYDRKESRWVQLKSDKIGRAIVMPKDKTKDQPEHEQTLYELKAIEPSTAGLWYAKWQIDDVQCATAIRVGTGRPDNKLAGETPRGMIKFVVPIDLNKSEMKFIPNPLIYCVAGGPGKPDETPPAKPAGKPKAAPKQ